MPFCIPSNKREFLLLHILTSVWWYHCLDFSLDSQWYLNAVLICSSLMTYDVEHLFIYLFAIWISSLVRHLFRPFANLKIGQVVFLLLSSMSSLYILNTSPLSDTCFAKNFSQPLACLFSLFGFCRAEVLNFKEIQFIIFFFC